MFSVKFWGVRGSYPTSDSATIVYGGLTSCVAVSVGERRLIFDAGTGIIPLGRELLKSSTPPAVDLFLSHTHHDHLFGLYFFDPLYERGARVTIFGPRSRRHSLQQTLRAAMEPRFFPVGPADFRAHTAIYSLSGGESVRLQGTNSRPRIGQRPGSRHNDSVDVLVHRSSSHPNDVLLYRVCYGQRSVVYATDIEENARGNPDVVDFARGADLLIHDAQYLDSEYTSRSKPRKGWGHSTVERALLVAQRAQVRRLVLFHHDPVRDDRALRRIEKAARRSFGSTIAARQGMSLTVGR